MRKEPCVYVPPSSSDSFSKKRFIVPGVFPTRVLSSTLSSAHSLSIVVYAHYFEVDNEGPSHPKRISCLLTACVSVVNMFVKCFDPTQLIDCLC